MRTLSGPVSFVRSVLVFSMLITLKYLSKIFYRHDFQWVGNVPPNPWRNIRLVAFLNHTSLFEPLFLGGCPNHFVWRIAAHGVVPAADKTTGRPLVGIIFKFVAHHVIAITRERDHTWFAVLQKIDPKSMVIIAPEGRMKRANGLDVNGNPMTVRGGIADILGAVTEGRMLVAYSGGLHHVQVPGHLPNVFTTVRLRTEIVDIGSYIAEMTADGGPDQFKRNVMKNLDARRDFYCADLLDASQKIA
jgi:Acyltransferase